MTEITILLEKACFSDTSGRAVYRFHKGFFIYIGFILKPQVAAPEWFVGVSDRWHDRRI